MLLCKSALSSQHIYHKCTFFTVPFKTGLVFVYKQQTAFVEVLVVCSVAPHISVITFTSSSETHQLPPATPSPAFNMLCEGGSWFHTPTLVHQFPTLCLPLAACLWNTRVSNVIKYIYSSTALDSVSNCHNFSACGTVTFTVSYLTAFVCWVT